MRAHVTSHPRIVRFFREFFGYPMATKVFKDPERGAGIYQNPDRGTAGTPGFLVNEADRVVDHILQKDRDVFATLLTTDEFIVYYNREPADWPRNYRRVEKKSGPRSRIHKVEDRAGQSHSGKSHAAAQHSSRLSQFPKSWPAPEA